MIYLSWAAMYEGAADRAYFEVLLPRIMEVIALADGQQEIVVPPAPVGPPSLPRELDRFTNEACALKDAVHLLFVHADTGGRGLARGLRARSCAYCEAVAKECEWPPERCVVLTPRHETESWVLADPAAVCQTLGYAGSPEELGLPADAAAAERLADPKAALEEALARVRGRRGSQSVQVVLPALAQAQSLEALRTSPSFQEFERGLRVAMASLGCIAG
jgi:hypothetical protein